MADPLGDTEKFRRLDPICDQFEAAWQQAVGARPRIEDFVNMAAEQDHAALTAELLRIELAYRQRDGSTPTQDEYRQRLPGLARQLLLEVFQPKPDTEPEGLGDETWNVGGPSKGDGSAAPLEHAPQVSGFEIIDVLGRGGMGVVYRARDLRLQRTVALKMILAGPNAGSRERERFQKEAEFLAQLQHPNIVRIYEVGEHHQQPFLSIEYVSGGSLVEGLGDMPRPSREAVKLVGKLARAIQAAHLINIVHRDLKPANILLTPNKEPKITDFGLAKGLQEDSHSLTGAIVGTPGYMAPEQTGRCGEAVGPYTDVYGLGAILYYLLTGHPPFESDSVLDTVRKVLEQEPVPPRRFSGVDSDLEALTLKCLEKDPKKRYASAQELSDDLDRYARGEPISARPIGPLGRSWRWCKRKPGKAALVAMVLVVLFAVPLSVYGLVMAEREANLSKQRTYVSDMRDAQSEWESTNLEDLTELLASHESEHELVAFEWGYWSSLCKSELRTLVDGEGRVGTVVFLANGKRLASAGEAGNVKLWDVGSGKLVHSFAGHEERIVSLALCPIGDRLASASNDKTVRQWSIETRTSIGEPKEHDSFVNCVTYDEKGKRIASGCWSGTVLIWDAETGETYQSLIAHQGIVTGVAFSPDGNLLATCGDDNKVKIWNASTGNLEQTLPGTSVDGLIVFFTDVTFSPDGSRLAAASRDHTVKVWDLETHELVLTLYGHTDLVAKIEFSRDGRRLVSGSGDKTVRTWNAKTGAPLLTLKGHVGGGVSDVAFDPQGLMLVSSSDDGTIKIWDAVHGQRPMTLTSTHPIDELPFAGKILQSVRSVAFHPDGNRLAAASWGASIKLCDLDSGETMALKGNEGWATHVVFSHDGELTAGVRRGQQINHIYVWETATGRQISSWEEPIRKPEGFYEPSLAFSPDGRFAASAGSNNTVKLWNARTGKTEVTLRGHADVVSCVAFEPDGRHLASGGWDKSVIIWEWREERPVKKIKEAHDRFVRSIAYSTNSRRLATGGSNSSVEIWDARTGEKLQSLNGHADSVLTVAFSPDGKRLASGGSDKSIRIWDADSGKKILTLRGHTRPVHGVAFSPDSRRLASASIDQTVRVWGTDLPARTIKVSLTASELADHQVLEAWKQAQKGQHEQPTQKAEALAKNWTSNNELIYNAACVFSLASRNATLDKNLNEVERSSRAKNYAERALSLLRQLQSAAFFERTENQQLLEGDKDFDPIRTQIPQLY